MCSEARRETTPGCCFVSVKLFLCGANDARPPGDHFSDPSDEPVVRRRLLLSYQQLHLFCALCISSGFLKRGANGFPTWRARSVGGQLVKERGHRRGWSLAEASGKSVLLQSEGASGLGDHTA